MTDTSAKRTDTRRRWLSSALLTVLLALGLIVTTLAISTKISVERIFHTGTIDIEIGPEDSREGHAGEPGTAGDPIFPENAPIGKEGSNQFAEPGMKLSRHFYVHNVGSAAVYYKLYVDEVEGSELADVLNVTIAYKGSDTPLFSGKLSQLKEGVTIERSLPAEPAENALQWFTVTIRFPQDTDNAVQGKALTFRLCADATQFAHNGEDDKPPVFENE